MALPAPQPDERAVITGASQGIGMAMARDLARLGHNVILVARRADILQEFAAELTRDHGIIAETYPVDLADKNALDEFINYLDGVKVNLLINSAGIASFGPFMEQDFTYERTQFALNAEAVFLLTRAALTQMVPRGYGAICNVGSAAGNMAIPNNATYVFTKAGVNAFTEALHYELKGSGVTVTLLAPGPVREAHKDTDELSIVDKVVPTWLWTTYETCSRETLDAISAGKRRIVPGPLGKAMDTISAFGPTSLLSPVAGWFYKKMA